MEANTLHLGSRYFSAVCVLRAVRGRGWQRAGGGGPRDSDEVEVRMAAVG